MYTHMRNTQTELINDLINNNNKWNCFFKVTFFSYVSFTQTFFFLNHALQDRMEILFLIKNLPVDNILFIGSLGSRTLCILINCRS